MIWYVLAWHIFLFLMMPGYVDFVEKYGLFNLRSFGLFATSVYVSVYWFMKAVGL